MANLTETDMQTILMAISALENRVEKRFNDLEKHIEAKFSGVELSFSDMKGDFKQINEKIDGLAKEVNGLDDRLKSQDGKIWTLITIIFGASITVIVKLLAFPLS